jgi:CDP-ribitol ribitolphosphotransferase
MNQKLDINSTKVYTCDEFSAIELLAVCDYLITDYSAIALEAAILDKKTYYYLHDYEEYLEKNGLNIDLFKEMPGCTFKSAKDLMESINKDKYNTEAFSEYKRKYLPKNLGNSTKLLVELILKKWEEN